MGHGMAGRHSELCQCSCVVIVTTTEGQGGHKPGNLPTANTREQRQNRREECLGRRAQRSYSLNTGTSSCYLLLLSASHSLTLSLSLSLQRARVVITSG